MKVAEVRRATDEEMLEHWGRGMRKNPIVLEMDTGDVIMAAQDPELNEAGHLIGLNEDGDLFDFVVSAESEARSGTSGEQSEPEDEE